ncbi:MAG: oligosaccharide flippase family protein [Promethearchaeota archaeon]
MSKIVKGASITLIGKSLGKAIILFYTILLANYLDKNELGLYFLGITFIGFITVLANVGFNVGVTRFVAINDAKNDQRRTKGLILSAALITIIFSLIITVLVWLIGNYISISFFKKPELGKVIRILSLAIPLDSLRWTLLAATRGLKKIEYTVYIEEILLWLSRLLFFLIFLFLSGLTLNGALFAYVVSSLLSTTMAYWYAQKLFPLVDKKVQTIFEVGDLLKFSLPMVFSIFLGNLSRQLDILMLGLFVSSNYIGVYTIAVRITVLAVIIFQVFVPIFNPFISYLYEKKDVGKLSNLLKVITNFNIVLSLPVSLLIIFFPNFFLQFFGPNFGQGAACLVILVMAHFLFSISSLPSSIIFMTGRSDITFKNNLAALFLNCLLNYLLIPKFNILGAAVATSSILLIISFIRIMETHFLLNIHPFNKDLWKPFLGGFVSMSLLLGFNTLFPDIGNAILLFIFVLFFITYFFIIYMLGFSEDEKFIKDTILETIKIS